MSTGVSCSRPECPGQGAWIPVFILMSEKTRSILRAKLTELGTCELHKTGSKLEDFLSPEGWERIAKHLREAGKGTFVKRSTRLGWERSSEENLLPF